VDIREAQEGEVLILAPEGSLSAPQDCAALERRIAAALDSRKRGLVVNCEKVTHVSGAALRVLLLASRKLAPGGGQLVLCGLNEKVRKAFTISGFDRDFCIEPDREAAVRRAAEAAVGPPPPAPKPEPEAPPADPAVPRLLAEALRLLALGQNARPPEPTPPTAAKRELPVARILAALRQGPLPGTASPPQKSQE
jgi:anti-anti-sigma factor